MKIGERGVVDDNYVETPEELRERDLVKRIQLAVERRNALGMKEKVFESGEGVEQNEKD